MLAQLAGFYFQDDAALWCLFMCKRIIYLYKYFQDDTTLWYLDTQTHSKATH
jgi:hypothetical protein